jgi:hypothetical protein
VEPAAGCSTATVSCRLFSGVGECFLDNHHVRVRVSVGEDPALAFAQCVHRPDPLERPVGGHRGLEPALRAKGLERDCGVLAKGIADWVASCQVTSWCMNDA